MSSTKPGVATLTLHAPGGLSVRAIGNGTFAVDVPAVLVEDEDGRRSIELTVPKHFTALD
jgi:hypothetical protein